MNTNKGAISGLNPDLSQGTLKYISQNTLGVALHRDQRENMDFRKNYYKKQWEQNTELQHVSFRLCCSLIQSCLTSYNPIACQAFLSFTISLRLLKLSSVESMMPSNHLFFFCPLLLLPSIFPRIRVFSNELSWLFTSGGQSFGVSASTSVLSMNTLD